MAQNLSVTSLPPKNELQTLPRGLSVPLPHCPQWPLAHAVPGGVQARGLHTLRALRLGHRGSAGPPQPRPQLTHCLEDVVDGAPRSRSPPSPALPAVASVTVTGHVRLHLSVPCARLR